jgi:hypothetical protein
MIGGLLVGGGAPVPLQAIVLRVLVAFLCGWGLGWIYSRSHGALSYSQNFVQSLVLLCMVVCVIMGVVGDSLTRAFGLAAALAVVRFRTPVKDARDTTFLFMGVAAGMAAGAGQLLFAGVCTLLLALAVMTLDWTGFGTRAEAEGILRFRFHGDEAGREAFAAVLRRHARTYRLTGARAAEAGGPEELVYDIDARDPGALVRELVASPGVSGVTLLPFARVGEA